MTHPSASKEVRRQASLTSSQCLTAAIITLAVGTLLLAGLYFGAFN